MKSMTSQLANNHVGRINNIGALQSLLWGQ